MEFLSLSDRIDVIPVVHGSGDCAFEARRRLLETAYDCLAVPLPTSFQVVGDAAESLPFLGAVVQREQAPWSNDEPQTASYVPIDPCQPVIAAIRSARQERRPIEYVDVETELFEPVAAIAPDPFALKSLSLEVFSGALSPIYGQPAGQHWDRCRGMASRLRELETVHKKIVFVCGVTEWPGVVDAYLSKTLASDIATHEPFEADWLGVERSSVMFLTEELPFIVGRYEQARRIWTTTSESQSTA